MRIVLFIPGLIAYSIAVVLALLLSCIDLFKTTTIDGIEELIRNYATWHLLITLAGAALMVPVWRRDHRVRAFLGLFLSPYIGLLLAFLYENYPATSLKLPVIPMLVGGSIFGTLVIASSSRIRVGALIVLLMLFAGFAIDYHVNSPLKMVESNGLERCEPEVIKKLSPTESVDRWIRTGTPTPARLMRSYLWHFFPDSLMDWIVWKVFIDQCGEVRATVFNSSSLGPETDPMTFLTTKSMKSSNWRHWARSSAHTAYRVEDGWLVGFNRGEFGASLWWFSPDGSASYEISYDHIVQFVPMNGELYAIEGLAHMSAEGKVLKITRGPDPDKHWIAQTLVDLHDTPSMALPLDNEMLVVTMRGLFSVKADGTTEQLLSNMSWNGLSAGTAVLDKKGCLYIGMKWGVAKWCKGDNRDSVMWLVPSYQFMGESIKWVNSNPPEPSSLY